jgi:phosphoribosylanthranilate isomerase
MRVRIKICGVTSVDDALAASNAGADALGLNFYPSSPRFVDWSRAANIIQAVPPFINIVGVFVNPIPALVDDAVSATTGFRLVQCHGEYPEMRGTPSYRLIPAFAVRNSGSLEEIKRYLEQAHTAGWTPAAILVDAHVAGQYGGTGQVLPWTLLSDFQPNLPVILAGGLTPENVGEAIRTVRPYAVDVASGVEVRPGRKDPEKVWRFIENAREASAKLD